MQGLFDTIWFGAIAGWPLQLPKSNTSGQASFIFATPSEARQSRVYLRNPGLPRRFASRNDDFINLKLGPNADIRIAAKCAVAAHSFILHVEQVFDMAKQLELVSHRIGCAERGQGKAVQSLCVG
jgi:hypothetical protein